MKIVVEIYESYNSFCEGGQLVLTYPLKSQENV